MGWEPCDPGGCCVSCGLVNGQRSAQTPGSAGLSGLSFPLLCWYTAFRVPLRSRFEVSHPEPTPSQEPDSSHWRSWVAALGDQSVLVALRPPEGKYKNQQMNLNQTHKAEADPLGPAVVSLMRRAHESGQNMMGFVVRWPSGPL